MKLTELSSALCGAPTACILQELNDWSCVQPVGPGEDGWSAIRGFSPSEFSVSSSSLASINCAADISYSLFCDGSPCFPAQPMEQADNSTCVSQLSANQTFSPTTLYDLVLHLDPASSPSDLVWSRAIPSYSSPVPYTMSLTQKHPQSSVAVHTLTFPTVPTFGCCEGYVLQAGGSDLGMCGMPATFHYTRDIVTPDHTVPINSTHLRAIYTIPSVPCVTSGYQAVMDVPFYNWQGQVSGLLMPNTEEAGAGLSAGVIVAITLGSISAALFLALLLYIAITKQGKKTRIAVTQSNSREGIPYYTVPTVPTGGVRGEMNTRTTYQRKRSDYRY